jgi:hypothetical protein
MGTALVPETLASNGERAANGSMERTSSRQVAKSAAERDSPEPCSVSQLVTRTMRSPSGNGSSMEMNSEKNS